MGLPNILKEDIKEGTWKKMAKKKIDEKCEQNTKEEIVKYSKLEEIKDEKFGRKDYFLTNIVEKQEQHSK